MSEWRLPDDGFGWHDGGMVEVDFSGEIAIAYLVIDEDYDGENEYPVPNLKRDRLSTEPFGRSIYDADGWRPVPDKSAP